MFNAFRVADPNRRPFVYDQRTDLTDPDVVTVADGKFVILRLTPPKGQMYVIKAIAPYAQSRRQVGSPDENFVMVSAQDGGGWFAFEPVVEGTAPFIVQLNYNAPSDAATPDNQQVRRNGFGHISESPYVDAMRMVNAFDIPVPGGQTFSMYFSIVPLDLNDPISNPYQVGTGSKRVDFAGAVLLGESMSEQYYNGARLRQQSEDNTTPAMLVDRLTSELRNLLRR